MNAMISDIAACVVTDIQNENGSFSLRTNFGRQYDVPVISDAIEAIIRMIDNVPKNNAAINIMLLPRKLNIRGIDKVDLPTDMSMKKHERKFSQSYRIPMRHRKSKQNVCLPNRRHRQTA